MGVSIQTKNITLLVLCVFTISCSTINSKKTSQKSVEDGLITDIDDAEKNIKINDVEAFQDSFENSDTGVGSDAKEPLSLADDSGLEIPSDESESVAGESQLDLADSPDDGLVDAEEPNDKPDDVADISTSSPDTSTSSDLSKSEDSFSDQEVAVAEDADPVLIQNISFKYNDSGGTILIDTNGNFNVEQKVNSQKNQLVLEIYPARIPKKLERPYIMKDFPKAYFASINAYQKKGSSKVRIVIQMKGNQAPNIQKEGNSLVIIPSQLSSDIAYSEDGNQDSIGLPSNSDAVVSDNEVVLESDPLALEVSENKALAATTLSEFLSNKSKFYGAPISIILKDVEIRKVIEFISAESGANIVIDEDVRGKISVKLRDVPWDQALITILRIKNLGYVRQGNILYIASFEELSRSAKLAKKIVEDEDAFAPTHIKIFPISFGDVGELKSQAERFLVSKNGRVVANKRINSLIVSDKKEGLVKIGRLIKELDIPPRQVLIEAKIIEATESFSKTIGINWGFNGSLTLSENGGLGGGPVNVESSVTVQPRSISDIQGAPVNFGFTIGTLDFLGDITSALALAETNGLAKVISSPRILTLHSKKAVITQKGELLSPKVTIADGVRITQVERTPVTLSLSVTPQITASNDVIMELDLKREFPGPSVEGERAVNTREASSTVIVGDGETAVVGGIYQSNSSSGESGLPVVKDIPIIGWLFKSKKTDRIKNELLMFVTPRQIKKNQANQEF